MKEKNVFSFNKSKIAKSLVSGVLAGAMLFSVVLAPVKSEAAIINGGINQIQKVSNDANSEGKGLNLKGGKKEVDFKIQTKNTVNGAAIGSKESRAVLTIPKEMEDLVEVKNATFNTTVSVKNADLATIPGVQDVQKIVDGLITDITKLVQKVGGDMTNIDTNLDEVMEKLDIANALRNIGAAEFTVDAKKVDHNGGKILIADVKDGMKRTLAQSLMNVIDNTIEALESVKFTSKIPGGGTAIDSVVDILNNQYGDIIEVPVKLLEAAKLTVDIAGSGFDLIWSATAFSNTDVTFHTTLTDPLFNAKDAEGKNLFMPVEDPAKLTSEMIANLTDEQTYYEAEFVGDLVPLDLLKIEWELPAIDNSTKVYFNFKNDDITTPNPGPTGKIDRISGNNRYATAVEVSKKAYETAETVIVAEGYTYADVLTATVLAEKLDAPILLTNGKVLPAETKAEIARLNPKKVILAGGVNTITQKVANELSEYNVQRLAGMNRYETAAKIAKEVVAVTGNSNDVIIVNGNNYPDGLVMTSKAVELNAPILLTPANQLHEATRSVINELNTKSFTIGGGTASVSTSIANELNGNVTRINGANRFETAVEVAKSMDSATKAVVTNGNDFVDALVAAPYSATNNAPLLLVTPNFVHDSVLNYVESSKFEGLTVVGGVNSVSNNVVNTLQNKLSASEAK